MTKVISEQIGVLAPEFSALDQDGVSVSLKDFRGHYVVLYFYPKDDTPGCTTQANEFTAYLEQFEALNTKIMGVSRDSQAKHQKFIAKHDLKLRLIADESGAVCEQYGVWVQKKSFGREYMGIERATWLIDPEGKIQQIWRPVKALGHAEQVLLHLKTLNSL